MSKHVKITNINYNMYYKDLKSCAGLNRNLITIPGQATPNYSSWCTYIHTINNIENLFLFFIGVAFIFLMPIGYGVLEYSHKTYFSENALLPGLVKVEFNMEHVARQYLEDLRHSINIRTVRSLPLLSSLLNWFKLVCGPLRQSNMH